MLSRVQNEQVIEAPQTKLSLDKKFVLVTSSADIDVTNIEFIRCTGSASISALRNGQPGQVLKILGNGTTTLAHGARIKTSSGVNLILEADKVYTLTMFDNDIWYEDA